MDMTATVSACHATPSSAGCTARQGVAEIGHLVVGWWWRVRVEAGCGRKGGWGYGMVMLVEKGGGGYDHLHAEDVRGLQQQLWDVLEERREEGHQQQAAGG